MSNQKYLVRCDRSGVFYGEIEKQEGREIIMRNVRCIWYWNGAASPCRTGSCSTGITGSPAAASWAAMSLYRGAASTWTAAPRRRTLSA